jgi:hypothetical protein
MAEVMREKKVVAAPRCDHLVQVYRDPAELAESVATFFAAGFEAAEPAVAVATAANWPVIAERLEKRGWRVGELEAESMLYVRDADLTLAAVSDGDSPSPLKFRDVIGGLIDVAAEHGRGRRIRAFGEMVDILVRRGRRPEADTLERYWNELGARRQFTLLCGYKVDLFDLDAQTALLPQVYRSHTEVLPGTDAERVELAVERAVVEVLGEADAQRLYAQVSRGGANAPVSHRALLWISAHMPRTAEEVLAAARTHYASAAAA